MTAELRGVAGILPVSPRSARLVPGFSPPPFGAMPAPGRRGDRHRGGRSTHRSGSASAPSRAPASAPATAPTVSASSPRLTAATTTSSNPSWFWSAQKAAPSVSRTNPPLRTERRACAGMLAAVHREPRGSSICAGHPLDQAFAPSVQQFDDRQVHRDRAPDRQWVGVGNLGDDRAIAQQRLRRGWRGRGRPGRNASGCHSRRSVRPSPDGRAARPPARAVPARGSESRCA